MKIRKGELLQFSLKASLSLKRLATVYMFLLLLYELQQKVQGRQKGGGKAFLVVKYRTKWKVTSKKTFLRFTSSVDICLLPS